MGIVSETQVLFQSNHPTSSSVEEGTVIDARMSHRKWEETNQQLILWPDLGLLQLSFSPFPVQHHGDDHGSVMTANMESIKKAN